MNPEDPDIETLNNPEPSPPPLELHRGRLRKLVTLKTADGFQRHQTMWFCSGAPVQHLLMTTLEVLTARADTSARMQACYRNEGCWL